MYNKGVEQKLRGLNSQMCKNHPIWRSYVCMKILYSVVLSIYPGCGTSFLVHMALVMTNYLNMINAHIFVYFSFLRNLPISPIMSIQAPVPINTTEDNPILLTLDVVRINIYMLQYHYTTNTVPSVFSSSYVHCM